MSVAHARNVVTGTLTSYVLLAVTIVLGIYLMPFTMRHLGQADYGLWMLVASMTAYFQLFDLGYGTGVVRQITAADARQETAEVNTILSTFLVVYSGIALAVAALTLLLIVVAVPRFPNLTPEQIRVAQYILGMLGLRMAIGFPMSIFGAVTTARQRFALTGSIAIVVVLLQGAATYVLLRAGYGVIALVAALTLANVLSYIAYFYAARVTFPEMRISASLFSRRHVREVTAFSVYMFLISIAILVSTNADNLLIGGVMGTSAVAVYMVAARLSEYQRQLCGQFAGFLFPMIVAYHASRDVDALRATLIEGTRIGLGLAAGVALGLILFGRDLVNLWMGPGFEAAVLPLHVLACAAVFMVAQGPTGTILLGTGQHRLVAGASVADAILNVVITVLLVRTLGLAGAALGTAIPYILINVFVLVPVACRSVALPVRQFIARTMAPTMAGLVPAAAIGTALHWSGAPGSLPILFAYATLVGLTYLLGFWLIGLDRQDRLSYQASARGLFRRGLPEPSVAL